MGGEVQEPGRVVIVGKGPTMLGTGLNDPRVVAALNGAARYCSRVDWLFVNDASALRELDERVMARVENLVIPTELHLSTDGKKTQRWGDCPGWFLEAPEVHLYRLPTEKQPTAGELPFFGGIISVGETAAAWLLARGHREFDTRGIDPERPRYHSKFRGGPQATWKKSAWYSRNWARIKARVEAAGGTIRREFK